MLMVKFEKLTYYAVNIAAGNHDTTFTLPYANCIIRSLFTYYSTGNNGTYVCSGSSFTVESMLCGFAVGASVINQVVHSTFLVPGRSVTIRAANSAQCTILVTVVVEVVE